MFPHIASNSLMYRVSKSKVFDLKQSMHNTWEYLLYLTQSHVLNGIFVIISQHLHDYKLLPPIISTTVLGV